MLSMIPLKQPQMKQSRKESVLARLGTFMVAWPQAKAVHHTQLWQTGCRAGAAGVGACHQTNNSISLFLIYFIFIYVCNMSKSAHAMCV